MLLELDHELTLAAQVGEEEPVPTEVSPNLLGSATPASHQLPFSRAIPWYSR